MHHYLFQFVIYIDIVDIDYNRYMEIDQLAHVKMLYYYYYFYFYHMIGLDI